MTLGRLPVAIHAYFLVVQLCPVETGVAPASGSIGWRPSRINIEPRRSDACAQEVSAASAATLVGPAVIATGT
jgi:hypothetical protein